MKIAFLLVSLLTVSFHAHARNVAKIGQTITVEGEQAEKLMQRISELPKAKYVINTPVVTEIVYGNVDCTLIGSHAESARELGESYSCDISL